MFAKLLAGSLYYCYCFVSLWASFKFYSVAPLSNFRDPSLCSFLAMFLSESPFLGGYFVPILNELFKSVVLTAADLGSSVGYCSRGFDVAV